MAVLRALVGLGEPSLAGGDRGALDARGALEALEALEEEEASLEEEEEGADQQPVVGAV